jgi:hypothetical protein
MRALAAGALFVLVITLPAPLAAAFSRKLTEQQEQTNAKPWNFPSPEAIDVDEIIRALIGDTDTDSDDDDGDD